MSRPFFHAMPRGSPGFRHRCGPHPTRESKLSVRMTDRRIPPTFFKMKTPSILFSIFVICGLGFLIYSNTFGCSFHFDDELQIMQNVHIQHFPNIKAVWDFWPTRFLTYLSFALNFYFHKLDVFGYHAVNLIIHLAASLCVFWFLVLTFKTPALKKEKIAGSAPFFALFAALIFVSHPVQTEGVTYIVQRAVSLATFFYMATLCFYAKARLLEEGGEAASSYWYQASWILALASMFTKEMTITLPFMVLIYERFFFSFNKKTNWKHLVPFFVIALFMPLVMGLTRSVDFVGMRRVSEPFLNNTPYHYLLTQFRVVVTYLRLLFIPLHQLVDYDYPVFNSIFYSATFFSFLFLTVLIVTAFRLARRYRLISFAMFWFFVTLLPESSIIPIRDVIFEHRLYLPMVGFSIFLPIFLYYGLGKKDLRWMVFVLIFIVLFYSLLTYHRNFVWKNEMTLWNDNVRRAPNKSRLYLGLGHEFEKMGNIEKAMVEYDKALALNPYYPEVYYNKANLYMLQKKYDLALAQYDKAIAINPDYGQAYHDRAIASIKMGKIENVISDFNKAVSLLPDNFLVYCSRGMYYAKTKDFDKALGDYDKALRLNPEYAIAYDERGVVYADKGDFERAVADFKKAIALNLRTAEIYNNLGFAYYLVGQNEEAIKNLAIAINLDQTFASAY